MAYLTRVTVSKAKALEKGITDNYMWHKFLWEAYPNSGARKRDFLFRKDEIRDYFRIFLVSPSRVSAPSWGQWQTKKISARFFEHDKYRYQLKANPTKRRNSDGRRIGLFKNEYLEEWIRRKAGLAGFVIKYSVIGTPVTETFVKKNKKGKHITVDFGGVLEVKKRERFKQAFLEGIGTAKAFGYGLLVLQPIIK
jgi:CRISPR system Cascade subunit CasE